MGFSRKRGRPKTEQSKKDLGTKELRAKRAFDLTIEPLDLCLKQQLINQEQYQAGMRLRWLYQLHFGSPNIKAYNSDFLGGKSIRKENEEWLAERFEEYLGCLRGLIHCNAKSIVMNVCVFHQRPGFLVPYKKKLSVIAVRDKQQRLFKFREGLDYLTQYFGIIT
jgi:hypothetical protein